MDRKTDPFRASSFHESNTAAVHVGRVLEIRVARGYRAVADIDAMCSAIAREMRKVSDPRGVVTIADWRRCSIISPVPAERLLQLLTDGNPRNDRSAALATTDSPSAVMQFVRLIRESGHATRRLFYDARELHAWVGEVLTHAEQARVAQFLEEDSAQDCPLGFRVLSRAP
jgi:hypothetical protein